MTVHRIHRPVGPTRSLHGPYWLWAVQGKRPIKPRPEGEVRSTFDHAGILGKPTAIKFEALDDGAASFLEGFGGGDLLVASSADERAFLFENVPAVTAMPRGRFELSVQQYVPLCPIPDEFEWPRRAPPPPSEEEIEAARRDELERETRLVMSDPGVAPIDRNRPTGRRLQRPPSPR